MKERKVYQFPQMVKNDGYEWMAAKRNTEGTLEYSPTLNEESLLFLSKDLPAGSDYRASTYDPLSNSALFKTFSLIEPNQEGIILFANEYGLLGGCAEEKVLAETTSNDYEGFEEYTGELLLTWISQSQLMKEAVDLWELARKGKRGEIKDFYMNSQSKSYVFETTPLEGGFQKIKLSTEWFDPNNIIESALDHVCYIVNKNLEKSVTPKLIWVWEGSNRLSLQSLPNGLIGTLWLQLAQAIDKDIETKTCATCGKWFALIPQEARKNRLYCSDACKVKAYRNRK